MGIVQLDMFKSNRRFHFPFGIQNYQLNASMEAKNKQIKHGSRLFEQQRE